MIYERSLNYFRLLFLLFLFFKKSIMNDMRAMLLAEMSRKNTDFVKDVVLSNPELFKELIQLALLNEEPVSRRAMWVIDVASEKNPAILKPYLNDLIIHLSMYNHDGLKRHTLRMLSRYDIRFDDFLHILDLCFEFIKSAKESVAVRYQAMNLLYVMSNKEPDLKYELATTIEMQMHEGSIGLKNHSRKLFSKLKSEITRIEK